MRRYPGACLAILLLLCGSPVLTGCGRHGAGASPSTDEQLNTAAALLDEHPDKASTPEDAPLLNGNERLP